MSGPDHEKLAVYQRARSVLVPLERIAGAIPEAHAHLRSQLRRASSSVQFNIAEGASEFSARDKARFNRIARRSAGECLSILDAVEDVVRIPTPTYERETLNRIYDELTKMMFAMQRRR